jgi:hypothetical protein
LNYLKEFKNSNNEKIVINLNEIAALKQNDSSDMTYIVLKGNCYGFDVMTPIEEIVCMMELFLK